MLTHDSCPLAHAATASAGDLIKSINSLLKKKGAFDAIIIETTGMADPAPVAQTFFVDEKVEKRCRLDGIITVVDAKHIIQHLDEEKPAGVENESIEQVAFADRILLNKIDLVTPEYLEEVKARLRAINADAQIVCTQQSQVDLSMVMNIRAFDLQKILASEPEFLEQDPMSHIHDKAVSSVGFKFKGNMSQMLLQDWLGELMKTKGTDLFRYKGVLAIKGALRFVICFSSLHSHFFEPLLCRWHSALFV